MGCSDVFRRYAVYRRRCCQVVWRTRDHDFYFVDDWNVGEFGGVGELIGKPQCVSPKFGNVGFGFDSFAKLGSFFLLE